jgi:hypothetical protein
MPGIKGDEDEQPANNRARKVRCGKIWRAGGTHKVK